MPSQSLAAVRPYRIFCRTLRLTSRREKLRLKNIVRRPSDSRNYLLMCFDTQRIPTSINSAQFGSILFNYGGGLGAGWLGGVSGGGLRGLGGGFGGGSGGDTVEKDYARRE